MFIFSEALYLIGDDVLNNNLMIKGFLENMECEQLDLHYRSIYDDNLLKQIRPFSIYVVFLTNKMIQSVNYNEWIKIAKTEKLKMIALIIEEIQNYDNVVLNDFDYYFEIYKARFNKTGFDYFLWISDYFVNFVNLIEMLLNTQLVSYIEIQNLNFLKNLKIFCF